jgi:hypothetical protein
MNTHDIFSADKLELLKNANDTLNITRSKLNKIIFIYSKPKVGSTSLVTSLRIFLSNKYNIIHLHDEEMLKVLGKIVNITINEIILYNKYLGKEIYVIDIYRSPIERKISTFFEKIDKFHFHFDPLKINQYDIQRLFNRFNKIFPHLGEGDHFIDTYNISIPDSFDFIKKYMLVEMNEIKYIKLRLSDSEHWNDILTNIFSEKIKIIKDYETMNKPINILYKNFLDKYKIPSNFLQNLESCKYLNYFYSKEEKEEYINQWSFKTDIPFIPFTEMEYKLYEYISIENTCNYEIQNKHYLDEGCICKICNIKRDFVKNKILSGKKINERIIHEHIKETVNKKIRKLPLYIRKNSPKLNIRNITNLR